MTDPTAASTARAPIGAVVLTWRDRVQTAECVRILLQSPLIDRVVVVDNEADGSMAAALPVDDRIGVVELAANTGFAYGVNSGLREVLASTGLDRLLVINNDATVTPASVHALNDALDRQPELGMVGPRIETPDGERSSAGGVVRRSTWGIRQPRPGEYPDFLTWACVLVTRQTLDRVGLLDQRYFMYWEDVDYGYRMRAAGVRYAEVADAVLIHAVSSSHSRAGSRILAYASSGFRHFLRQHGGPTKPLGFVRMLVRLGVTLAARDRRGARYVWAGWRIGKNVPDPAYPVMERLA